MSSKQGIERSRPGCVSAGLIALMLAGGCEQSSPNVAAQSASSAATSSAASALPSAQPAPETAPAKGEALPADAEYAALLGEIVSPEGMVRYELLDEPGAGARLTAVIAAYAAATMPSGEASALAFGINAYNVNAIALAAAARSMPDFTSVNAIPGFFDSQTIAVGGRETTLSALEDELRARQDPRIHAALVRASRGSPALRAEPYSGERLNQQLDQQCVAWFDDLSKNRTTRTGLVLTEILKWREEDFAVEPYGSVRGFVFKRSRSRGMIRDFIRNVPDVEIVYAPFDWRLNQALPPDLELAHE